MVVQRKGQRIKCNQGSFLGMKEFKNFEKSLQEMLEYISGCMKTLCSRGAGRKV